MFFAKFHNGAKKKKKPYARLIMLVIIAFSCREHSSSTGLSETIVSERRERDEMKREASECAIFGFETCFCISMA